MDWTGFLSMKITNNALLFRLIYMHNIYICRLTNLDDYSLRIQMWDTDSNHAEVTYERFRLTDAATYNVEDGQVTTLAHERDPVHDMNVGELR